MHFKQILRRSKNRMQAHVCLRGIFIWIFCVFKRKRISKFELCVRALFRRDRYVWLTFLAMNDCATSSWTSTSIWRREWFSLWTVLPFKRTFVMWPSKLISHWNVFCNLGNLILLFYSFLYTILADNGTSSTPVLIVCNKQDETMAKGETVVKALLEKEL